MVSYEELKESVIAGQEEKVKELVSVLLDRGNSPLEIVSEGLISGMSVWGRK